MATESTTKDASARKNEKVILQRLASVGQARLAKEIGVNESTVSRMKDGEIERISKMLACLGLKCVPAGMLCFDPKQVEAILTLAKARLHDIESASELVWDEGEE